MIVTMSACRISCSFPLETPTALGMSCAKMRRGRKCPSSARTATPPYEMLSALMGEVFDSQSSVEMPNKVYSLHGRNIPPKSA